MHLSHDAKWDQRWLRVVDEVASWSKDSTQVGCVIVGTANQLLTAGYNGFPRGVDDEEETRTYRPEKYMWTEHAERNAIYNAAREGVSLVGSTAYLRWYPCCDCARGLIQVGISTLVSGEADFDNPTWGGSFLVALIMLEEAGVENRRYSQNGSRH